MEGMLHFIIVYGTVQMMTMLFIEGQAGGNYNANKGGGSNYHCLPNDPDNGKPSSYHNDVLYGAEYEVKGSRKPVVWI
jgi:hypothetical protein